MNFLLVILLLSLVLIILGIIEKKKYIQARNKIDKCIYVNGTRGKSTTTRLIASGLRKAGYRVMAKTTGTEARLIYPDGSEIDLKRRGIPRIIEQVKIISKASQQDVDILVLECMAISPEMQWVSEHLMVKSDIGVITNIRRDHTDKMGDTLEEIGETLSLTVPAEGSLVTAENKHLSILEDRAKELNSTIHPVDGSSISEEQLKQFTYPTFRENAACATKTCQLLDIDRETALKGMYDADPDPGAVFLKKLKIDDINIYFINAFAANDLVSTEMVWDKCREWYQTINLEKLPVIGLLNNRRDRNFRIKEMTSLIGNKIKFEKIYLVGNSNFITRYSLDQKNTDYSELNINKNTDIKNVIKGISQEIQQDYLLFGFGNTKNMGMKIIEYFIENGDEI